MSKSPLLTTELIDTIKEQANCWSIINRTSGICTSPSCIHWTTNHHLYLLITSHHGNLGLSGRRCRVRPALACSSRLPKSSSAPQPSQSHVLFTVRNMPIHSLFRKFKHSMVGFRWLNMDNGGYLLGITINSWPVVWLTIFIFPHILGWLADWRKFVGWLKTANQLC